MELSIIIVSWNVREYLARCLDSIAESVRLAPIATEIIVVDSASSDSTVEMLHSAYPHVRTLPQAENVGFTRGNNIGLAAARGEFLLLLNPDTEVRGDALAQMVSYMRAHERVGILGAHTLNSDGTHQSSRRRFPTLLTALFESTWLQPYAPRGVLERFYAYDIADTDIAAVDWVQGSALLLRRAVYEQIGGLDEGYVMFSEEVDFCKRAKQAGWQVIYHGGAYIVHHGGKSTEQASAAKHIHFQQSKVRYFRKFHGAAAAAVLRLFLIMSYFHQLLLESLKGALGSKRALRRERVRLYWQVIRALWSSA
ncbi:MAG: glycosyltransferase family 2 protein [Candidatus Thermofonsia Clade 1 bacterium]|jgi:GT2 family glycosyltransferase|uniref:Glycosyltransferase family 2 protein n=1 Tax=Candidatus Thermofonsia Clade 1 bacterium TaxID=2364210 RepID=A0A2M8PDW7_9CHLR|nr:MAG: glycosyltransferase family 2 protein [Candidatus Thermofonsia Clade 1 bacterium]